MSAIHSHHCGHTIVDTALWRQHCGDTIAEILWCTPPCLPDICVLIDGYSLVIPRCLEVSRGSCHCTNNPDRFQLSAAADLSPLTQLFLKYLTSIILTLNLIKTFKIWELSRKVLWILIGRLISASKPVFIKGLQTH
jgi:hypothetical protein